MSDQITDFTNTVTDFTQSYYLWMCKPVAGNLSVDYKVGYAELKANILTGAYSADQALNVASNPTFASVTGNNLTASTILYSDANKKVSSLPLATYPSLAELAFLKGQNQSLKTTDSPTFAAVTTTGLATLDTTKIGDVAGGNYTEFEADGTLISHGDSTCYMDVIIPLFLRGVPSEPEAIAFPLNGIGLQPRFRIDDILTLQNAEAPHDWEEGSAIEIHMHFSNSTQDATDRYVKLTLEYAIANKASNGNTNTQFVRGTQDVEILIPANTPAYTHLYATLKVIDAANMASFKIGAGFVGSIKRIAATGAEPSGNPYVLNLGIHYKANTLGSRTTTSK